MTPPPFRRLFGYSVDAVAGGSNYAALTAGAIPDANLFAVVTGGTFDYGVARIDRSPEVRGFRPKPAPIPFRAVPVMTVQMPAYLSGVKKLLKCAFGAEGAITGSAPGPYTHPLSAVGMGQSVLPALMPQLVRDTVNEKLSGAYIERMSLNFPLDGDSNCEVEFRGLYGKQEAAATSIPTPVYTGYSTDPLLLRDATLTFDGGATVLDITGFQIAIANNIMTQHYAGQNVVSNTIGVNTPTRKLHFPYEHRINAADDITYGLTFANTADLQELAHEWGQLQKIVVTIVGPTLASITGPGTPAVTPVGSGGTFTAGTYFWKVTAVTPNGESQGSTEVTAAIVLNGSATLTWLAVPGATAYKVYRSTTTGGEGTTPALVTTTGNVLTYTDTGSAVTAGAVPPAPGFAETLRFTIYQGEHTGGSVDALAARGALGSNYTGEAFYSSADANDVLVEVIDGQATAL